MISINLHSLIKIKFVGGGYVSASQKLRKKDTPKI